LIHSTRLRCISGCGSGGSNSGIIGGIFLFLSLYSGYLSF